MLFNILNKFNPLSQKDQKLKILTTRNGGFPAEPRLRFSFRTSSRFNFLKYLAYQMQK